MPKPAIDEQGEIVTILDAIDRKIDLHRRKRAVLDELFKVLLHKLMAGEVRVGELDLLVLQLDHDSSLKLKGISADKPPNEVPGMIFRRSQIRTQWERLRASIDKLESEILNTDLPRPTHECASF